MARKIYIQGVRTIVQSSVHIAHIARRPWRGQKMQVKASGTDTQATTVRSAETQ